MIFKIFELDGVREFFINLFNTELKNTFRIAEQIPGVSELEITGEHPFVHLIKNKEANVFPAVVIGIANTDQENSRLAFQKTRVDIVEADIDRILLPEADERLSPKTLLEEVRTEIQNAGGKLSVVSLEDNIRTNIRLEVWTENNKGLKNKLVDILYAILFDAYDILQDRGYGEINLGTAPEGMYNYDFARNLYGGAINFDFEREMIVYRGDTSEQVVDKVLVGTVSTQEGNIKLNDPPP